jgi:hypothetical protein
MDWAYNLRLQKLMGQKFMYLWAVNLRPENWARLMSAFVPLCLSAIVPL